MMVMIMMTGVAVYHQSQEVDEMEKREGNLPDLEEPPAFGSSSSSWEDVEAFYSHWTNFVSCLPFDWADEYTDYRQYPR